MSKEEPEILARALIYIYTGVYESENIANGLVGEIRQFCDVSDRYAAASKAQSKDCELCIQVHTMADWTMLPELQTALRHIFLQAYYGHRKQEKSVQYRGPLNDDYYLKEKLLVELVYATSRPSDWTFKTLLVQNAHAITRHYQGLAQAGFVELLEHVPRFAVDVARTRRHTADRTFCGHQATWLERRCECGSSESCDNEECNKQRTEHSLCIECGRYGAISFPL